MSADNHATPPGSHAVETDDPDTFVTACIGLGGFALLVVVVVFLQGLYERTARLEADRKGIGEAPQELMVLRAAQIEKLSGYRVIDPEAGIVAIPIERAIELMIRDARAPRSQP